MSINVENQLIPKFCQIEKLNGKKCNNCAEYYLLKVKNKNLKNILICTSCKYDLEVDFDYKEDDFKSDYKNTIYFKMSQLSKINGKFINLDKIKGKKIKNIKIMQDSYKSYILILFDNLNYSLIECEDYRNINTIDYYNKEQKKAFVQFGLISKKNIEEINKIIEKSDQENIKRAELEKLKELCEKYPEEINKFVK